MSARTPVEATRLWLVLARCHRVLNQIAERSIEETGLGLTDFAALEALLHKGPLTITEIHGKVPLALGSMTAAIDRLEKKGLIIRTAARDDRRAKVLKLTPEGKRVVENAFGRHATQLEWVARPDLASHGDHIGVSRQDDPAIAAWADARKQRRLIAGRIGDFHIGYAEGFEIVLDKGDEAEVGLRTLRIEADQTLKHGERCVKPFIRHVAHLRHDRRLHQS